MRIHRPRSWASTIPIVRVVRTGSCVIKKDGGKRRYEVDWDEFDSYGSQLIEKAEGNGGAGFAVLISPTSSPSIVRMLSELQKRLPKATIARYDGVVGNAMTQGTKKVLGTPSKQSLDLSKAKVIVSIQSDFLGQDAGVVTSSRTFAEKRDPMDGDMSRLYVVEGGYTLTGAAADSKLSLRPSQMPAFISELGRRVAAMKSGNQHDHGSSDTPYDQLDPAARLERFLDAVAHDVADAGAEAVVLVGDHLGADAIAAGIHLNESLGSLGTIQKFTPRADAEFENSASLSELAEKIDAGEISSLLVLGGNPVVTAPGEIDFGAAVGQVKDSIYLGDYDDETGVLCQWSLPLAHPLESWGDVVDEHGNYGVCQPQIFAIAWRSECSRSAGRHA